MLFHSDMDIYKNGENNVIYPTDIRFHVSQYYLEASALDHNTNLIIKTKQKSFCHHRPSVVGVVVICIRLSFWENC